MSTSANNIYVAWDYFYGCGERTLHFAKSDDNGKTFSSVTLADSTQSGSFPAIASDASNVYLSWVHYNPPSEIFFKASDDNGTSFANAVIINATGINQADVQDIIASGKNIGIIWTGIPIGGVRSIYLSVSFDGGKSFAAPVLLSSRTGDSFSPQLVQAQNKAFILWSSFGDCDSGRQMCAKLVYFNIINIQDRFSMTPPVKLGTMDLPRIAVSGNNVYVAGILGNIVFLKSSDAGTTFGLPVSIPASSGGPDHLNDLGLVASGDHVYITWYDFRSPELGADLLVKASSDGGNTFGQTQTIDGLDHNLSQNGEYSLDTQVSASGSNYYAIWQSYTDLNSVHQGIFLSRSTDGCKTLEKPVDLSNKVVISNPEYFTMSSGNNIYIAGPDYGFEDGNHIVFTSSDAGNTFATAIDLDRNSEMMSLQSSLQLSPSIKITSGPAAVENLQNGTYLEKINFTGNVGQVQKYMPVVIETFRNGEYYKKDFVSPTEINSNGTFTFVSSVTANSTSDSFTSFFRYGSEMSESSFPAVTATAPEFPFAVPILLFSVASLIIFYRIKIAK